MNKISNLYFGLLIAGFVMTACMSCREKNTQQLPIQNPSNTSADSPGKDTLQISVTVFPQDSGWGYDIFVDGKKYIHQPYVPAVSGLQPFLSREDALKAGHYVAQKIRAGILPPSVSPAELDSLGVLPR